MELGTVLPVSLWFSAVLPSLSWSLVLFLSFSLQMYCLLCYLALLIHGVRKEDVSNLHLYLPLMDEQFRKRVCKSIKETKEYFRVQN
jgi:hypothetical protein